MALRHVLHRADALPRVWLLHYVATRSCVLDSAVRHQQPQLVGEGARTFASLAYQLRQQGSVIWMNPGANSLECEGGISWQLENAIELVGEGDVVRVQAPGEATGRTDSLSVCEV